VKEYFHKKSAQSGNSFNHLTAGDNNRISVPFQSLASICESPKKKGSNHFQPLSKTIKIDDLRRFFHMPINEVAHQLGTCATALKKICRRNKIMKWPFRQIRSITKSIQSLEYASLSESLTEASKAQYKQQISTLKNAIDDIIRDPNLEVTLVNIGFNEEAFEPNCNQSDSNDDVIDSLVLTDDGNDLTGLSNMYDELPQNPINDSEIVNNAMNYNSSAESTGDCNGQYLTSSFSNGLNLSHTNSTDSSIHTGQQIEASEEGKTTAAIATAGGVASKRKYQRRHEKRPEFHHFNTSSEVLPTGSKRPSKAARNAAACLLVANSAAKSRKHKIAPTASSTGGEDDGEMPFFDYYDLVDLGEGSSHENNNNSSSNNNNSSSSNQRRRLEIFPVDFCQTTVNTDPFAESLKSQFIGPVHLAMLQRKKTFARTEGMVVSYYSQSILIYYLFLVF